MWKSKLYTLAITILLYQAAFGQEYTIPFRLTEHNNISVPAILNGKDTVNLMFHTAANSVMLTEEATQKMTSISFNRTDSVKSWGGDANTSRFSKSNTLQIGQLTWNDLAIWEDKNSGPGTDGKFGINLFENKVIEIDFEKKIITLSTALPAKAGKYEKLKLTTENDLMFMEARCETGKGTYTNKFLIHSGYFGAVLLDDAFVAQNNIDNQLQTIDEKSLKDSYGNVLKTKRAMLPAFFIGKEKLPNIPVGFFTGSIGRQKMSIIGGDVLKRFSIIIDAQRQYVYLKTNNLKAEKYTGS